MPPTSRQHGYHHGDLRRALLEAGERLIRERGTERVGLRSIARAAGVSHAAPYHHFEDLDGLLAAIAATGFVRLRDSMLRGAADSDSPALTRLQEAGIAYVRFAVENPELYRLMFSGRLAKATRLPELQEASSSAYAVLGSLLKDAVEPPTVQPPGDREATAHAAWAMVHGMAMLIIDGRLDVDRDDAGAVEEAVRRVTRVLGPGLRGA